MNKIVKILLASAVVLLLTQAPLYAAVEGEVVKYMSGDTSMVGYIAYDKAIKGKRPGVIVVPDWWGHGEFVRDRANALAKLGYTAMVMDIYGDGTYVEPAEEAKKLMNDFVANPKVMQARFEATKDILSKHRSVNSNHIAAIGYSLGGLVVLEMARIGIQLDGVASIWGVIAKPAKPAKKGDVTAKVLVLHPSGDGWAPTEAVNALKVEMKDAGADYHLINYSAKHGFSRPDADRRALRDKLPIQYSASADKKSWNDLRKFLKVAFK